MLLHFDLDFLRLLLVLIHDFRKPAIICLLLLLLLLLRAEWHTDVAVVIYSLLKVAGLSLHRPYLLVNARPQLIVV